MNWTFSQSTGLVANPEGIAIGRGYAGKGPGMDNPAMQDVRDVGPLPQGWYTMNAPVDHPESVGAFAIPLLPDPENEMDGRSDFYIHGDNPEGNHSASDGCIVLPYTIRQEIVDSGNNRLEVVA